MTQFSFERINCWGVLAAVAVEFFLGLFWYGPIFGSVWLKHSRWTEKTIKQAQAGMTINFVGNFIQNIVGNFVLAALLESINARYQLDWIEIPLLLTLLWAAFHLPSGLQALFWEGDKWQYFVINQTNRLASFLIPGILYYNIVW